MHKFSRKFKIKNNKKNVQIMIAKTWSIQSVAQSAPSLFPRKRSSLKANNFILPAWSAVWLLRSQNTYMKKCYKNWFVTNLQLLWSILIYFDVIFNLKGHTKKLNRFVKLHKRHCLFLHQSTYSTFPSFMNSHFTFAPSLAEEIFFERALNSISKSNLHRQYKTKYKTRSLWQ